MDSACPNRKCARGTSSSRSKCAAYFALQRLLLLSLGQVAQQTAQQSRQHRAAQRTRHLEVELAALALVHDQPHVVVHAELLEDVGLALQHGAGVVVGVVAGGLGNKSREEGALQTDTW